jgi:hypothetical protein
VTRPAAALLVGLLLLQAQAPRYRGALLRCAAFTEEADAQVVGRSGVATVQDRISRRGLLVITLRDSAGLGRVTAWYDSLSVWRDTDAGREPAETDGFVGGRYEGVLSADGRYQRLRTPFVPGPLAEMADLAAVLDDFLPRLPGRALEPGDRWRDSTGLEIERIEDSRVDDRPLNRYRWTADRRARDTVPTGNDSLAVEVEQRTRESGELTWSVEYGPLAWSRTIGVDAHVPARLGVTRSLASRVDQRVRVFQVFDHPACAAEGKERP